MTVTELDFAKNRDERFSNIKVFGYFHLMSLYVANTYIYTYDNIYDAFSHTNAGIVNNKYIRVADTEIHKRLCGGSV